MKILLHKQSNDRHALEIIRDDGRSERVECETRSYLVHDLLHYALESTAKLEGGFWGHLARGKTLAQMNDRDAPMIASHEEMALIERTVGALSMSVKGKTAAEVVTALRAYAESMGTTTVPQWVSEERVAAVQERMRQLLGMWKATAFGGTMELGWPER